MVSAKRKRENEPKTITPRKLRTRACADDDEDAAHTVDSPSRTTRAGQVPDEGTPRSILKKHSLLHGTNGATPRSNRKLVFSTPSKTNEDWTPDDTPINVRHADRSARRTSNRRLLERTLDNVESDHEALDEEDELAQRILSDEEGEDEETQMGAQDESALPETPSKRGRGRPKGSKKSRPQRSPTPPHDLPPHEEYFWQNRAGGNKTSNNTLSAQSLLNHDEYFQTMQLYEDRHKTELDFLLDLHGRAYSQWVFELEHGFNICLYGYGSKRPITEAFAAHLYEDLVQRQPYRGSKKTPKIVIINGYTAGITLKEVLTTIATTILPAHTIIPNQPASLVVFLLNHLSAIPPPHPIPIIVNSIDAPCLRKSPIPSLLANLAAHPSITLLCTADTPNFSLLWDVGLKAQYNFLFHDATTFTPYNAEIDVVESVNELLGRSGRRVGGRDGVAFVLRSLPENARSLFRILVTEQLALLLTDDDGVNGDQEDTPGTPKKNKTAKNAGLDSTQGVEYRVLYHKAVEEFVCSSEVGFRTLLKEFHDHQMIESKKDAMGTERLWVPFRLEELEELAEDLSEDVM